jgi:rhodanese-related sulfurtransferase
MTLLNILKDKKGTIVDVRSPEEFMGGHVVGSINIPLQEIPQRIDELKNMVYPLILCCASGMRSSQAHSFLHQQGIPCMNGGGWTDVNFYRAQAH